MHGRSVPSAGNDLLGEFAGALGGWEWDVALLQEVPPWWPALLGERLGAGWRLTLTSRNALPALRRAVAVRWPDAIKSNGGGCNAILVRRLSVVEHRTRRLCVWPERRRVQAVRLGGGVAPAGGRTSAAVPAPAGAVAPAPAGGPGLWVGNLHATVHDAAAALRDIRLAAATALRWAGGDPVVLGGDFNVRSFGLPGFTWAGGHDVDHVFAAGPVAPVAGSLAVLERGRLSDHAPVAVSLTAPEL